MLRGEDHTIGQLLREHLDAQAQVRQVGVWVDDENDIMLEMRILTTPQTTAQCALEVAMRRLQLVLAGMYTAVLKEVATFKRRTCGDGCSTDRHKASWEHDVACFAHSSPGARGSAISTNSSPAPPTPVSYGLLPMRCFTCMRSISNQSEVWEQWLRERVELDISDEEMAVRQHGVLCQMGMRRKCCRCALLTQPVVVLPHLPLRPVRADAPDAPDAPDAQDPASLLGGASAAPFP